MIHYNEALQQVVDSIVPLTPVDIPLQEAAGLALATSAAARWAMPRCHNSAMDGFAICGASGSVAEGFPIIGAAYAGHSFPGTLSPGEAVRITTGAPLPVGADTVVPVEDCDERDGRLFVQQNPKSGQHVRYAGEEFQGGEILVVEGTTLRAGEIALLASAGIDRVRVCPRPRVAVISTGDELVELGQIPGPGQIINSNQHFLRTRLYECNSIPISLGIGADDPDALEAMIDQALNADLIITTGGVSVGDRDHIQDTLQRHDFEKIFWRVAIKPGKPLLFGRLSGKPFFGLPGNPAATAATFELFVRPALQRLGGDSKPQPRQRKATLTGAVKGGGKRQAFLWCQLEWVNDRYLVTVRHRQGSGQNRALAGVNALLPMPVGTDTLAPGQVVDVWLLNE